MFLHRDKFLKNDLLMFEKNFDEKIKIRRSLEKILGLVFLIDFLHLIESEVWNPRVELCLIIINSNSRKNLFDQTDNSHSLLRFFSISEFLVKSPNYDSPKFQRIAGSQQGASQVFKLIRRIVGSQRATSPTLPNLT